jgi:hypothetical protein
MPGTKLCHHHGNWDESVFDTLKGVMGRIRRFMVVMVVR